MMRLLWFGKLREKIELLAMGFLAEARILGGPQILWFGF
jgi:hypothetical protein